MLVNRQLNFKTLIDRLHYFERARNKFMVLEVHLLQVSIFKNFAPYFWLIEIGYSSINFETGSRRLIVSMLRYVDSVCLPDFLEKKKSSEKLMRLLFFSSSHNIHINNFMNFLFLILNFQFSVHFVNYLTEFTNILWYQCNL